MTGKLLGFNMLSGAVLGLQIMTLWTPNSLLWPQFRALEALGSLGRRVDRPAPSFDTPYQSGALVSAMDPPIGSSKELEIARNASKVAQVEANNCIAAEPSR